MQEESGSTSPPLHVVVIGGGIGGLCLAQGLKRAGVSVAVYERDLGRNDRSEGYRIHINPAGSRALHECLPPELWDAFVSTAGEPGPLAFLTERLERLTVIEDGEDDAGVPDPKDGSHAADRVTLRRLLLAGLDDVVHFGKRFERYERLPDGRVTAFFADGTSATGDVLVGADGANSSVRRRYLPEAERRETEALSVALKLPLTDRTRSWLPPRVAAGMNMVVAPDPFFLFTSAFERRSDPDSALDGLGEANGLTPDSLADGSRDYDGYVLCAFVAHEDAYPPGMDGLDGAGLKGVVEEMVSGWHPDLRRVIREADLESVGLIRHGTSDAVPAWESTNVTLLGDAIHSMPPVGGLGGNTALRDARLLHRKLAAAERGEARLIDAIGDYEAEMRDYGFAAVRTALKTQARGLRGGRLAVAGARAWFRLSDAVPSLRRGNQPYAGHARKRPWERGRSVDTARFESRPGDPSAEDGSGATRNGDPG